MQNNFVRTLMHAYMGRFPIMSAFDVAFVYSIVILIL